MKKSWAMKWVKALRSGKYKQTTRRLRDEIGHCCLGVLCTLTPYKNNYTKMEKITLPEVIKDLVGMKTYAGDLKNTSLVDMNDNGYTFEQIANIIEKEWEKL